jgi:hypothetical protein
VGEGREEAETGAGSWSENTMGTIVRVSVECVAVAFEAAKLVAGGLWYAAIVTVRRMSR